MRLTAPMPLDAANVHIDAYDLAKCVISNTDSSQLFSVGFGSVKDIDLMKYFSTVYTFKLPIDLSIPRISAAQKDDMGIITERREHLVIRDLDLLPYLVEQDPDSFKDNTEAFTIGRIVARADYRFRPKGWNWQVTQSRYQRASEKATYPMTVEQPQGSNSKIIEHFGIKAAELLDRHCRDQECYELMNLETNVSHKGKGLAKQLVEWLFPFCDEQGLDYKLMASPVARGLYRRCGFVEDGEDAEAAISIDLGKWGGSGIYEHVCMVRHPEKAGSPKAEGGGRGT